MGRVGKERAARVGDRLLERVLGRFVPGFVSLPLLLVRALFRVLRFERGLAWLRTRGAVGLFCWIDTLWLVATITWVCTLVFGRQAYGFGIFAGLVLFVVLHSLIAHAADYFAGYDPAKEFMKEEARPSEDQGTSGPGGPGRKEGTHDGPIA